MIDLRVGSEIRVGAVLEGKYEIVRVLGQGAMGVVFEARHRGLNKRVAVKTIHADLVSDDDLVARFHQEAQAASGIGHPNIVQVTDLGTVGGTVFMVMEFLEGESLGDLLAREPLLTPDRIGRIVAQVLSALAAAHARGIVHRDLKPDNVFLTTVADQPEFVKLLDFGIAKILRQQDDEAAQRRTPKPTEYGMVMGTPQYMSPEQARGLPSVDHRIDLWAAGCVLYEGLCGRVPFDGDNYNQVLVAIVDGHFARPSELRPSISPGLEAVVLRAMTYAVDQRYASAADMRRELEAALAGGGTSTRQPAATTTSGLQSGLAAANPSGEMDAVAAVEALGNLGEASLSLASLDGADDGGESFLPASMGAPATPAASAPADSFAPPAPSDSAFGPPPQERELSLDVSVVGGDIARPATPVPRARRDAPKAAGTIYRPSKGAGLAGVLKVLFAVLLLGAIGGGAYRYYTLGYLLSPPPPKPVTLTFAPQPDDAELFVNGELLAEPDVRGDHGEAYELEMRAPGRLSVRRVIAKLDAKTPTAFAARLPHGVLPVAVDTAAAAMPDIGAIESAKLLDAASAKLAHYRSCADEAADPLARTADAYRASTTRGAPSKKRLPSVVPLPRAIVDQCKLRLDLAADAAPLMAELDQVARGYADALGDVARLSGELAEYYDKRLFESDDFELGKRDHAALVAALDRATAARGQLATIVTGYERAWVNAELAVLGGEGILWHLRTVAARSDAFARAATTQAKRKALKAAATAFADAIAAARQYAGGHRREVDRVVGADGYLRALGPLEKLAAQDELTDAERAEVLTWHNQGVELFNKLVLIK